MAINTLSPIIKQKLLGLKLVWVRLLKDDKIPTTECKILYGYHVIFASY